MLLRLVLLEPEEHLALKPVLELLSPHHGLQDPLDGPLRVLLLGEVLEDGVHRDLRPDSKALLQLLFDAEDGLLVLLGGETFSPGQIAGHGGRQSRNLNSKWGEYETMDAPDPSSELPGYPASLKEGTKKIFFGFLFKRRISIHVHRHLLFFHNKILHIGRGDKNKCRPKGYGRCLKYLSAA